MEDAFLVYEKRIVIKWTSESVIDTKNIRKLAGLAGFVENGLDWWIHFLEFINSLQVI